VKTQSVLVSVSLVALAALASQAGACLGTSSTPPSADSGSGSSSGGSGSSSGGSGSSSGGSGSSSGGSGGACTPADPTAVIDDMSGAMGTQNATGGYWYTYSDRTVPNSEPPILLSVAGVAPPGAITPAEGLAFPISDSGMINGCTWGYREAVGGGEKLWGAGFGMDFNSTPPDGGQVPFNQCDAGQIFNVNDLDSGTVGIVQPYDAHTWTGIQFWGISFTGKSQSIFVQIDDDRTSPWGGSCNACNSTGGTVKPCSDSFRHTETLTSTWQQFTIAFSDPLLTPQNWSKNGVMPPIHSDKIYNLHFQVTAAPAPVFDLGIAMVQFYK
jgi:hypothetical protein